MTSRKGLEFAIGTLVTIILGAVIVGMGILLLGRIVDETGSASEDLFDECRGIARQAATGQLLALSPAVQEVKAGEGALFCGALRNQRSNATNFSLGWRIVDAQEQDVNDWRIVALDPGPLGPGEEHEFFLQAIPSQSAPSGGYTILLSAFADMLPYESRFVTVRVE